MAEDLDPAEIRKGIQMVEEERFDEAIELFESLPRDRDAVVPYGLATALFRARTSDLAIDDATRIVGLYQESIELDPKFADAYLMCGMAYAALATALGKSEASPQKSRPLLVRIDTALERAAERYEAAAELNPAFKEPASDLAGTTVVLRASLRAELDTSDGDACRGTDLD